MAEDRLPTPQMVLDGGQYRAEQLAREVEERAKDPLDRAKRPGGFFLTAAGDPVDAEGRVIPDDKLSTAERSAVRKAKGQKEQEEKPPAPPAPVDYNAKPVAELKELAAGRNIKVAGTTKADYVAALEAADRK